MREFPCKFGSFLFARPPFFYQDYKARRDEERVKQKVQEKRMFGRLLEKEMDSSVLVTRERMHMSCQNFELFVK